MKPLLIFGLRGTLVERIHVRGIPPGMPQPDLTVGLSKVWLRPQVLQTLLTLQEHCHLALWSSTTRRNTAPLIEAVFQTPRFYEDIRGDGTGAKGMPSPATPSSSSTATEAAAATAAGEGVQEERRRFSKRRTSEADMAVAPTSAAATAAAAAPFVSPIKFEFVWSREHTRADDFRRRNAILSDDNHATVKDLGLVFQQFPTLAQPHNTILIDDTPSKAKFHADNFLWLDTCEGIQVQDTKGLPELCRFVQEEVLKAEDVRTLLPRRIRGGSA